MTNTTKTWIEGVQTGGALCGAIALGWVMSLACGSSLPTPADARDALTRSCIATASVEALVAGRQLPPQIEQFCSNPTLQDRIVAVVREALELEAAVHAVPDAGLPFRKAP